MDSESCTQTLILHVTDLFSFLQTSLTWTLVSNSKTMSLTHYLFRTHVLIGEVLYVIEPPQYITATTN